LRPDSIVMNGPLITKVAMPKVIFPLSRSLSSLINLVISLVPLLAIMLISGAPFTPALLLAPAVIALLFLFALGMTLLLCTMNVFFRDVRFLWSVVSLLWTYATPIFYPITIIPEGWRVLFMCNPMYQFINCLRTITIGGAFPAWTQWGACLLCAVVPLGIGWMAFRKNEDKFVFHL
jgi:ABC-2 type transport system permease protein